MVLFSGVVVGPGSRLTHVSLKQESPGPLTHLSCLRITHCLLELSDKSPIPSAGSSHSKELTAFLPLLPSFCPALRPVPAATPPPPTVGSSHQSPGLLLLFPPACPLSSFLPSPFSFPVLNSPTVTNMLTRFPCSWPLQARTAHVLPPSWWFPAPLPCPRHERLNVQVSLGLGLCVQSGLAGHGPLRGSLPFLTIKKAFSWP